MVTGLVKVLVKELPTDKAVVADLAVEAVAEALVTAALAVTALAVTVTAVTVP